MARSRFCDVCKQPIEQERADGNPETRLCREHAEAIQKFGGEFRVTAQQERTSKSGSLKINYGGIETKSVRNQEAIERLKDEYRNQQE
jgi:hypothetical protein